MKKSRSQKIVPIIFAVFICLLLLFKLLTPGNIKELLNINVDDINMISVISSTNTVSPINMYYTRDKNEISAFTDLISNEKIKLTELFPRDIRYSGNGTIYDVYIRYNGSNKDKNLNITTDGNIYYGCFKFSFVNTESSNEIFESINDMITSWQNAK